MLAGASVTSEWFHSGSLAFGGVADSSARARGGEGVGSRCLESTSLWWRSELTGEVDRHPADGGWDLGLALPRGVLGLGHGVAALVPPDERVREGAADRVGSNAEIAVGQGVADELVAEVEAL